MKMQVKFEAPPNIVAFKDMAGVDARFFTAMRTPHTRGLDCSVRTPEIAARNQPNRELVAQVFRVEADQLLTMRQSNYDVCQVAGGWGLAERPEASAAVMSEDYDHVIGVLTSDCAPVLFADKANPIVAAAHVGWRDAANNILEHSIAAMEKLGSRRENIVASIGPSVGVKRPGANFVEGNAYKVEADFYVKEPNSDPDIKNFMFESFDLSSAKAVFCFAHQMYVEHRLKRCGIEERHISRQEIDTMRNMNCYSRRINGPNKGVMFSGIKLVKPVGMGL